MEPAENRCLSRGAARGQPQYPKTSKTTQLFLGNWISHYRINYEDYQSHGTITAAISTNIAMMSQERPHIRVFLNFASLRYKEQNKVYFPYLSNISLYSPSFCSQKIAALRNRGLIYSPKHKRNMSYGPTPLLKNGVSVLMFWLQNILLNIVLQHLLILERHTLLKHHSCTATIKFILH